MRIEKFTMERDVLQVGDVVHITESRLPRAYYYTVEHAAAMSGNFELTNRIQSTVGKVMKKVPDGTIFILDIGFEE